MPNQEFAFLSEFGVVPYVANATHNYNHYIYITSAPIACNPPALDPSVVDLSGLSRLSQVPTSNEALVKNWPSLYKEA